MIIMLKNNSPPFVLCVDQKAVVDEEGQLITPYMDPEIPLTDWLEREMQIRDMELFADSE